MRTTVGDVIWFYIYKQDIMVNRVNKVLTEVSRQIAGNS